MRVIMIRWHAMHFIHSSLVKIKTNATFLHAGHYSNLEIKIASSSGGPPEIIFFKMFKTLYHTCDS